METMFEGDIFVSYGQMMIENPAAWDVDYDAEHSFAGQVNGLCGAGMPERLWMFTGLHTGWVRLTVEHHDTSPALDQQWEEIVEASFTRTGAPLQLMGLMANEAYPLPLPTGVPLRVRYCATGMDAARDGSRSQDDPVLDRYLIQLWPAPPAPDTILRRTSRTAMYWHDRAPTVPTHAEIAPRKAQHQARTEAQAQAELAERERRRLAETNLRWGRPNPHPGALAVDHVPDDREAHGGDPDAASLPAPFDDPTAMWRALDHAPPIATLVHAATGLGYERRTQLLDAARQIASQ